MLEQHTGIYGQLSSIRQISQLSASGLPKDWTNLQRITASTRARVLRPHWSGWRALQHIAVSK